MSGRHGYLYNGSMNSNARCSNCGELIDESQDAPGERLPCPSCGATGRTISVVIHDTVTLSDRGDTGYHEIHLRDFTEVSGFFLFADVRGFSVWARKHQGEVRSLTKILYSVAQTVFGAPSNKRPIRRLVKFLGDGFLAVGEYSEDDHEEFLVCLGEMILAALRFMPLFHEALQKSTLHDKSDLHIGFGMAYGSAFRFHLPGKSLDYVGNTLNLAARLCGTAGSSEVVFEYDLRSHLNECQRVPIDDLEVWADSEDLKSFGNTAFYRLKSRHALLMEKPDLRFIEALMDSVARSRNG